MKTNDALISFLSLLGQKCRVFLDYTHCLVFRIDCSLSEIGRIRVFRRKGRGARAQLVQLERGLRLKRSESSRRILGQFA
jgi:hypothetical protein